MKLQRLMDEAVDAAGLRDYVWWVGGYVLGISVPPDWVGHVYLNDEEGFERGRLRPGVRRQLGGPALGPARAAAASASSTR